MSIFQGDALPDVTTTQTTATTTPDWYNTFLSGLSTGARDAVTSGGIANFSDLQNQAFAGAPNAINAGTGALSSAQGLATASGGKATDMISDYMNPFTQNVVNEIGRLGQKNFNETLAPGATSGAVGSGQFGSKRGMQVYGNVAGNVNADILGRQTSTLASGFDNALKAAQMQQESQRKSAETLSGIGKEQYTQGTGGLSILNSLGAQQQALEQARLNYPMTALENQAGVMRGYTVPTSTTNTYKGPMPGSYANSDFAQLLGAITTGGGTLASISDLLKPYKKSDGSGDSTPLQDLLDSFKNFVPRA
jgi:hypothetical protein